MCKKNTLLIKLINNISIDRGKVVRIMKKNMNKIRMCYNGKYKPTSNNLQVAI